MDWYFLIPAAISQIFDLISELVITIETPSKEAKEQSEIHPIIAEAKIRKYLIWYRVVGNVFVAFQSTSHFALFLQGNKIFLCLYIVI